MTSENLVYIVDFDTARYYESGQEQDTELLGTKEYAPPEQYGFGQSDARSDIYALGIIFNRLLTGEYPKHQLADDRYRSIIQNVSAGILKNVSRRLRNLRQLYTIIFPLILENLDLRFLRYILIFQDFVLESCGK